MLFYFLKYVNPIHYFQLFRKDGNSIFPIVESLSEEIKEQLESESTFESELAREYDLSWQAINKGYIGDGITYKSFEEVTIVDQYRFLRKYFHSVWVLYVLTLRLLCLKNPVREIVAFNKSGDTRRSSYLKRPIQYKAWSTFESSLISHRPLVSVVIPTLNRYDYLKNILSDFEKQSYSNFEILIIDQSVPFKQDFCQEYKLRIRHIFQEEPALWLARNTAIKEATGDIIALSEDDVRIPVDWIENHLKALDFFKADISAGVFFPEGHSLPEERSFFCIATQFATGNAMLYKRVFKEVGLFDRQFEKQRMGDGEFGLRAYLSNFKSISNPFAYCEDVKATTGGLRQMGGWDGFRPKKWFGPRPVPSVLYQFRKYYGTKATLFAILKFTPPSIMPYQFKRNRKVKLIGFIISFLLAPLVIIQVIRSWKLATIKLKEGPLIEKLKE